MKPLDTSVKGSPGTLSASADFLNKYAKALESTAHDLTKVNNTHEADWHGPAADECGKALDNIDSADVDELTKHVRKVAHAERDFQHALNAVVRHMHDAINTAQSAGLELNGPLIMPPTPPGHAPKPPSGKSRANDASDAAQQYKQDAANHKAACHDYNRKLAAYKKAKSIINKARSNEQNAHKELNSKIADSSKTVRGLVTVGTKATTWATSYVKGFHGAAREAFEHADKALKTGQIYQSFNAGNLINLTAEEKSVLHWGQTHAQELADGYTKKGEQLEKFVSRVPKNVKKAAAANPGKSLQNLAGDAKYLKWAKPALKNMPYLGTAAGLGSNLYDAVSGQKSFGRAAAQFSAETAGGAAGGWAGGALALK